MSPDEQLDLTDDTVLKSLIAKDNEPKSRGGSKGKPKYDLTKRDIMMWFKLPTTFNDCSNPKCEDPRRHTRNEYGVKTMVLNIEDVPRMCRYCYLDGFGLDISPQGV